METLANIIKQQIAWLAEHPETIAIVPCAVLAIVGFALYLRNR